MLFGAPVSNLLAKRLPSTVFLDQLSVVDCAHTIRSVRKFALGSVFLLHPHEVLIHVGRFVKSLLLSEVFLVPTHDSRIPRSLLEGNMTEEL